jgi:hypothetical protein
VIDVRFYLRSGHRRGAGAEEPACGPWRRGRHPSYFLTSFAGGPPTCDQLPLVHFQVVLLSVSSVVLPLATTLKWSAPDPIHVHDFGGSCMTGGFLGFVRRRFIRLSPPTQTGQNGAIWRYPQYPQGSCLCYRSAIPGNIGIALHFWDDQRISWWPAF